MTTTYPTTVDATDEGGHLTKVGEGFVQESTVDGSHSAGAGTLTVADATGFGSVGYVVIGGSNPEEIPYASRTGTVFTLEGTLANAHADGDPVVCLPTGLRWNNIIDALVAVQNAVGVTGSFNFLLTAGGTMSGNLSMGDNTITNFNLLVGTADELIAFRSDHDVLVDIDYDDDSTSRKFYVRKNASGTPVTLFQVNEDGSVEFSGDPGTSGQVLTSGGTSAEPTWEDASAGLPKGYIAGLTLRNDTDADHDIEISVGVCRDDADTADAELTSALTKRIDAAWAVGDNNGGMATGTVAADTPYYVWIITKDSDGSVDAMFDIAAAGTNVPSGYTVHRRIGVISTDSSSNVHAFDQAGNIFKLRKPVEAIDIAPVSTGSEGWNGWTDVDFGAIGGGTVAMFVEVLVVGSDQANTTMQVRPDGETVTNWEDMQAFAAEGLSYFNNLSGSTPSDPWRNDTRHGQFTRTTSGVCEVRVGNKNASTKTVGGLIYVLSWVDTRGQE